LRISKNRVCNHLHVISCEFTGLDSSHLIPESQGFGLTIGSDFYLVIDRRARRIYYHSSVPTNLTYTHGQFITQNGSNPFTPVSGVLGLTNIVGTVPDHTIKGATVGIRLD